jgi:endonuclease III
MKRLQESPYQTRQEEYRDEPWKMLMVCMMLNQTSHKQVDQVRHEFFSKYPTPQAVVDGDSIEMAELIKSLGFYNKRVKSWKRFCLEWMDLTLSYDTEQDIPYEKIESLHGIGKYAVDSWRVFQKYEYDIEVQDHVLVWYVEWAREEAKRQERESSEWKPTVVYYLHYKDQHLMLHDWQARQDYSCCVMARTIEEAIERAKQVAKNDRIKIMGVVPGRLEWVSDEPLGGESETVMKWKAAKKDILKITQNE